MISEEERKREQQKKKENEGKTADLEILSKNFTGALLFLSHTS